VKIISKRTGESFLLHDNMTTAEVLRIVLYKHIHSKDGNRLTSEWAYLTRIVKDLGFDNITHLLRIHKENSFEEAPKALLTLTQFETEVLAIQKEYNPGVYTHPTEWFLRNWTPPETQIVSWTQAPELMSLREVLLFLLKTSPGKLRIQNDKRYTELRLWVEKNFRLSLQDFYRFFILRRIPALENLIKSME
jgi:hypothetical protein